MQLRIFPPRVVLVACGASKLDHPAPAKDLYTGQLFQKARAYAERVGAAWFILSAKYGVLHPERIVEPYDARVPTAKADRRRWGIITRNDLNRKLIRELGIVLEKRGNRLAFPRRCAELELLAGRDYVDPLMEAWGDTDAFAILDPLQGLMIGERLSWLNAENRRAA